MRLLRSAQSIAAPRPLNAVKSPLRRIESLLQLSVAIRTMRHDSFAEESQRVADFQQPPHFLRSVSVPMNSRSPLS
jgi:hypothetical protein